MSSVARGAWVALRCSRRGAAPSSVLPDGAAILIAARPPVKHSGWTENPACGVRKRAARGVAFIWRDPRVSLEELAPACCAMQPDISESAHDARSYFLIAELWWYYYKPDPHFLADFW